MMFFNYWLAYFFDDEFFFTLGFSKKFFDYTLFVLIAIAIIALVKLVGIILIIALLTLPTAMAKLFSNTFNKIIFLASGFSFIFIMSGLYISYVLDIPSGASIIISSATIYFITLAIKN